MDTRSLKRPVAMTQLAFDRLSALFKSYQSGGSYLDDQKTNWDEQEWLRTYVDDPNEKISRAVLLESIHGPLSRAAVFARCQSALTNDAGFVDAFIVVMMWGFKPKSYGAYRTSEMLKRYSSREEMESALRDCAQVAQQDPLEAYKKASHLAKGLGPAFGTKYTYFMSPESNRSPIFDAVVANWLWHHNFRTDESKFMSSVGWNSENYKLYVDFCTEAAEKIGVEDLGLIEYLMFIDQQFAQWRKAGAEFPLWLHSSSSTLSK